ncbi:MAG TPA: AMP-binding protein, partial [Acidimicrobiales bacterium]|nr:AMP-binding protein [Acidimicrobiales bacterium]
MNLAAIIEGHPDERVALVTAAETVTYGELRARVAAQRAALVARAVERGQRLGVRGDNTIDFVVLYLAVLGVGAVVVPLNPESPPIETGGELTAVGATGV